MNHDYLIKDGKDFALSFSSDVTEDMQAVNICLSALNELMPCVQPLSVDFRLKCRNQANYSYESNILPPISLWHMEELSIPSKVIINSSPIANITQVPNITIDVLSQMFEAALQQQCPCPTTHELCWTEIEIWATRARIFNEINLNRRNVFVLSTSSGNFEYPIEHRQNGTWVYGPIASFPSQPLFTVQFYVWYGYLILTISVYWSTWYNINSPGYNALKESISKILDQGWRLSEYTPLTEPKII